MPPLRQAGEAVTLRRRIERALADGPGTAMEIALALGRDSRRLNAYLRDLWLRGHLTRSLYHPPERAPSVRHRVWMYAVKE